MAFLKLSSQLQAFWNGRLIIFTPFASLNEDHEQLAGKKNKEASEELALPTAMKG